MTKVKRPELTTQNWKTMSEENDFLLKTFVEEKRIISYVLQYQLHYKSIKN